MRVIAGRYRSRTLVAPRGLETRPTSDRLRETLFNVLAPLLAARAGQAVVLDLFAGSGALGIEALSRGARTVHFVDASRAAMVAIRRNLAALGIVDGFELHERDALQALRRMEAAGVVADLCLLDPPYRERKLYDDCLEWLGSSALLAPGAIAVAEHERRVELAERHGSLTRYRVLTQGDAALSFYRQPAE